MFELKEEHASRLMALNINEDEWREVAPFAAVVWMQMYGAIDELKIEYGFQDPPVSLIRVLGTIDSAIKDLELAQSVLVTIKEKIGIPAVQMTKTETAVHDALNKLQTLKETLPTQLGDVPTYLEDIRLLLERDCLGPSRVGRDPAEKVLLFLEHMILPGSHPHQSVN